MAETLLMKNVKNLVTCDDNDRFMTDINMLVTDGVITYIGTEEKTADKIIDASRMVVYPGLINSHHHLYQTFTRNLPQVQNMELFPWLKTLYEIWKGIDGDSVYYSSLTGMGELLKTGCTTCLDHHYVFPEHSAGALLDAQFAAADALGIRMAATRGSMDLSVKDGGLPPDSVVQTIDEILRDSQAVVEKYHDSSRYSMHTVALAPCSPFSVTGGLLRESAGLARSLESASIRTWRRRRTRRRSPWSITACVRWPIWRARDGSETMSGMLMESILTQRNWNFWQRREPEWPTALSPT